MNLKVILPEYKYGRTQRIRKMKLRAQVIRHEGYNDVTLRLWKKLFATLSLREFLSRRSQAGSTILGQEVSVAGTRRGHAFLRNAREPHSCDPGFDC